MSDFHFEIRRTWRNVNFLHLPLTFNPPVHALKAGKLKAHVWSKRINNFFRSNFKYWNFINRKIPFYCANTIELNLHRKTPISLVRELCLHTFPVLCIVLLYVITDYEQITVYNVGMVSGIPACDVCLPSTCINKKLLRLSCHVNR